MIEKFRVASHLRVSRNYRQVSPLNWGYCSIIIINQTLTRREKMSFSLQESEYIKIRDLFVNYPTLLTQDFENRIKRSICVLHFAYLWGACKEAQAILYKYPTTDIFSLIMRLYTKKRKFHQANFLLLHCFENALRSTLAVKIADLYNKTCDDWFLQPINSNTSSAFAKLLKIVQRRCKGLEESKKTTWRIFDCFYLIDLQEILEQHWSEFASVFKDEKIYKNQTLPSYGTKEHLITKISQIRTARNDVFHNKPTKIKFQKDLEILLLRLGYNLEEAINIGEVSTAITLQYNYKESR